MPEQNDRARRRAPISSVAEWLATNPPAMQQAAPAAPLMPVGPVDERFFNEPSPLLVPPTVAPNAVRRAEPGPPRHALSPGDLAAQLKTSYGAWNWTHGNVEDALAKGDYGRAAGAVLGGPPLMAGALADDLYVRPVEGLARGIGGFLGGMVGIRGGNPAATAAPTGPSAAAAALSPEAAARAAAMWQMQPNVVDNGLAQGRVATEGLGPQGGIESYLDNLMQSGATINQMEKLAPLFQMSVKSLPSMKDSVLGSAAEASQKLYEDQIRQARELAETDKERAKLIVRDALAARFRRESLMTGGDTSKIYNPEDLIGPVYKKDN